MTFGQGSVVMLCQLCHGKCHPNGPRQAHVPVKTETGETVYQIRTCPQCCCHDCVQMSDHPVMKPISQAMLGQTFAAPFNLEQALAKVGAGLQGPSEPKTHRIAGPKHCAGCGKTAKSRCIDCNEPLCSKCLKKHECEAGDED